VETAPGAARAAQKGEEAAGLILVVDDEEVVRRTAAAALTRRGYRVRQASSGREGIEILQDEKGKISLALLDLTMPGLSGQETLLELRKFAPDLEVVVSSGYGEEQAMKLFAGQHVSGFIQKPYTADRLLEKVVGALRNRRLHAEAP
jgi:DNA-binding NtrC family response regulator